MKKQFVVFSVLIICAVLCVRFSTQNAAAIPEIKAIKKVIVESYIEGVFTKGDAALVKKGFHPDCDVFILNQGQLIKAPASSFIERLEKNPGPMHGGTTYEFTSFHVTEYAGLAVVEIYQDGRHIYTDYMNLYKFDDGWKVVTKIYYRHPKD